MWLANYWITGVKYHIPLKRNTRLIIWIIQVYNLQQIDRNLAISFQIIIFPEDLFSSQHMSWPLWYWIEINLFNDRLWLSVMKNCSF